MTQRTALNSATKLSHLLSSYPWLKDALPGIHEKFRMLHTPMGAILAKTATISDMSDRSGLDETVLIDALTRLIASHR